MKTTKLLAYIAAGLQFLVLVGILLLTFSQKSIIDPHIVKEMGKGFVLPLPVIVTNLLFFLVMIGYAVLIQFTGMYNKAAKNAVGIGMIVLAIMVQCLNPYISLGIQKILFKLYHSVKIAGYSSLISHINLMTLPVSTVATALFYLAGGSYLKANVVKKEETEEE